MKLVVGLGNPGKKYEHTPHNLGFLIVDRIAGGNEVTVRKKLCDALVGEWCSDGEKVLLLKPQTYMNCSGEAVRCALRKFGAAPDDLVVVYDDLDLPFGRIRIRPRGGAGGHRGLASIIEAVGGAPFYRVRIGIGRPPEGMDAEAYVLEPFSSKEMGELNDDVIPRAAEAVLSLLKEGGQRAMERFNRAS